MRRRDVTCQLPSRARSGEGDLVTTGARREGVLAPQLPRATRSLVFWVFVRSSSRSRSRRMSPQNTPFFHVETRSTDDRPIFPEHVFFGVIRDMIQNRTRTRKQGILGHVENPNRQWCTNPSNGILNCGWRAAALLPPRAAVWIFPPRE